MESSIHSFHASGSVPFTSVSDISFIALQYLSGMETHEETVVAGATFAIALGCWSPATQNLSSFNTDPSSIISYLANATSFNESQFQHADLPDSWSWGFSGTLLQLRRLSPLALTDQLFRIGTCQLYIDPSKRTKCYHAFPPLFSAQDLVAKALSGSNDSETRAVISTWNSALAAKPSDPAFSVLAKSDSQRKRSVSLFRGGAAALVFSLLISLCTFFSSFFLFSYRRIEEDPDREKSEREFRHKLYGVAIFDFLLFAGAIICFSSAMMIGPAALEAGRSEAPITDRFEWGFVVVLAALLCRIASIPVIGVVVVCILGVELLFILAIGYLMFKCFWLLVKDHEWNGA
jgi:hypothetical protein